MGSTESVGEKGDVFAFGTMAYEALSRPHAQHCMPAGRPMTGFILVDPDGVEDEDDLSGWLALARRYVESLPPKQPKSKTPKKKHHKPTWS